MCCRLKVQWMRVGGEGWKGLLMCMRGRLGRGAAL